MVTSPEGRSFQRHPLLIEDRLGADKTCAEISFVMEPGKYTKTRGKSKGEISGTGSIGRSLLNSSSNSYSRFVRLAPVITLNRLFVE